MIVNAFFKTKMKGTHNTKHTDLVVGHTRGTENNKSFYTSKLETFACKAQS